MCSILLEPTPSKCAISDSLLSLRFRRCPPFLYRSRNTPSPYLCRLRHDILAPTASLSHGASHITRATSGSETPAHVLSLQQSLASSLGMSPRALAPALCLRHQSASPPGVLPRLRHASPHPRRLPSGFFNSRGYAHPRALSPICRFCREPVPRGIDGTTVGDDRLARQHFPE